MSHWKYLGGLALRGLYVRDYQDKAGVIKRIETKRDAAGEPKGAPKISFMAVNGGRKFKTYDAAKEGRPWSG